MRTMFGLLFALAVPALSLLSLGIYFFTLYLAYLTSFQALLGAMFFPVLAQLYWIWILWGITGTFFHTLTLLCLVWITIFAIVMVGSIAAERLQISNSG